MDPDANWQEQQQLKAAIKAGTADAHDRARLRELRAALREWLARGGFPPKGISRPRGLRGAENPLGGLSNSTKTALWIGGGLAAVAALIAFWPKSSGAAAATLPPPTTGTTTTSPTGRKFTSVSQITPGGFYEIAMSVPLSGGQPLSRMALSAMLAAHYTNLQILYYPGDPLTNWPIEVPQTGNPTTMIVFAGDYTFGTTLPVSAQMTAMQLVA